MVKGWSHAYRLLILFFLIIGVLWLMGSLTWVISLLLISLLIVYILNPFLLYLKKRFRIGHGLAVSLVFIVFLLCCLIIISLLIPVIYYEVTELIDNFPHYVTRFQSYFSWLSSQIITFDAAEEVRNYLVSLSDNLYQALEYMAEVSLSLIGGAIDFFLILFLVFYLLYDFQAIRRQILEMVPLANRHLAEKVISIVDTNVGTFIRGSLIRCTIVGIITGIVLLIIGMPYALLLGLLAGIFNFILYIGPYIAAVPAVLLSFSPLTPSPILIIAVYVVIQVLDGIFLAPVVLGRAVNLKPITIIVSILVGGSLAGLLGMVLAVPLSGIIKGIVELIKQGPAYQKAD